MKNIINSSELAFLMDITPAEAKGKILHCLPSNSPENDEKFPKVSIIDFEKKHNINLQPYLSDIWNNFFTRKQTYGWIMDYPRKKIWHGKDYPIPKKISLPKSLSGLINPEVLTEIKKSWEERYIPILPNGVEIKFQP